MGLKEYKAKRHFDQTPEPEGKVEKSPDALKFVIQKHAASHLHYDFRLEMDGVLKSWAIPKGPSLNPADKRLAMMVEDHPMSYRLFEGIIPKGNYGAGTVMVWDMGTYYAEPGLSREENEKKLLAGLHKGKITFTLEGEKLHGEFALVKTRGRYDDGRGNSWLLIKHDDEYVTGDDIREEDTSVISDRDLDQIKRQESGSGGRQWQSNRGSDGTLRDRDRPDPEKAEKSAKKKTADKDKPGQGKKIAPLALPDNLPTAMPHHVQPMLATLVEAPFDDPDWLFEIKWDGYRAVAEIVAGRTPHVEFYSRKFHSFEQKFKSIFDELKQLGRDLVLDGEVVALDDHGQPSFQLLQNYAENQDKLAYYVFDLLYVDGRDIRRLPLVERKRLLAEVLSQNPECHPHVLYCDHVAEKGEAFFQAASAQGLEGIMAKEAQGTYETGSRSATWLKVKTHKRQEFIICGYTEPKGKREAIGALLLGVYDEQGQLHDAGHTGTGMNTRELQKLKGLLRPLEIPDCPFIDCKGVRSRAERHWVKPELVCEVKFQEWTEDGQVRQAAYLGLRPDKSAREVKMETEKSTGSALRQARQELSATGLLRPTFQGRITRQAGTGSTVFSKEAPARSKSKEAVPPAKLFSGEPISKPGERTYEINGRKLTFGNLNKVYFPELGLKKKDLIEFYERMAPVMLPYLKDRPMVLNRFPNGIHDEGFYQKDQKDNPLPDWIRTEMIWSESNGKDLRYIICDNKETIVYLANLGCIDINPWNSRIQSLENPDWMVIDLDPWGTITFNQVIETARVVKTILDEMKVPSYPKTSGKSGIHIFVPMAAKYSYEQAKEFGHLVAALTHQELPRFTSIERDPKKRQNRIYLDYLQTRKGQTLASVYSVRPIETASVSTPLRWEEVKKGLKPSQFTVANIFDRLEEVGDLWRPVIGKGIDLEKSLDRAQKKFLGG